ncbi:hypothetical protein, partial [Frankia sp. EI5c]|uniref:hypothetical protein n=1 Tax=Frankia sp. EI5c TaxID=683316 RepID=UPI001A7EEF34
MAPPVDSIKDSTIAVIGDPACFWAVLPVDDEGHWSGTEGTSGALERSAKTYAVEAGSLLVHNLLTGTSPGDKSPYIDFNRDTDKVLESENLHHYYGALKNYENSRGDPHKKKIRISHFSGHQLGSKRTRTPAEPEKLGHEDFDTLVVCDLGLSKSFSWPHSPGGWTLLEINGARIEERASLKKFKDAHSENVVPNTAAILDVGALRRAGWEISADLSWERSTLDLLAEFEKHRRRATDPGDLGLQKFEFVVCTFRQAGALMIHNLDHEETGTLFFHPDVTEGSFDQKNRGSLFGLTSVICAAVADELHRVQRPEAGNIEAETNPKDAIRNGIAR